MRIVFRLLALISLSIAVIMAVVDATRSIAADAFIFTPLAESWRAKAPESLLAVQAFFERTLFPILWDPVMLFILSLPGWLVFAVLALGFHALGHRGRNEMAAITR